jgi:hypothetical protein
MPSVLARPCGADFYAWQPLAKLGGGPEPRALWMPDGKEWQRADPGRESSHERGCEDEECVHGSAAEGDLVSAAVRAEVALAA